MQAAGIEPVQFEQLACQLSGGQQNLLLMVRAMLSEPDDVAEATAF